MTLQEAIEHCNNVATIRCIMDDAEQRKCSEEHQQLAGWLTKLADYENVMPITEEWLIANKFHLLNKNVTYKKSYGKIEIEATFMGYGIWQVSIFNSETALYQAINLCTKGQVKMFFGIYGMENLITIN
jgi:hypothetical protein